MYPDALTTGAGDDYSSIYNSSSSSGKLQQQQWKIISYVATHTHTPGSAGTAKAVLAHSTQQQ